MKKTAAKKPVIKKPVPPIKTKSIENKVVKPIAPTPPQKQHLVKPAAIVPPVSKAIVASATEISEADAVIKRPVKLFFIEVKPGAERVIKRGDKSLTTQAPLDIQARRKDTAAEETSEELVERIERELQYQSFFKRSSLKPQMCTKCGINVVTTRFTIDRELGYCGSCAEILRLGTTKEARRMEFNPSMKKEEEVPAPAVPIIIAEVVEAPVEDDEEPIPDID